MEKDFIEIHGLEARRKEIESLSTTNRAMYRELQKIIRKAINEARKNIVKDARDALDNDPRQAYKAVRNSVYKQLLGGQVNIISPYKRGAPTKYQRPRKLDKNPKQRGGNRMKRSEETMRYESYHGKDRSFILRWLNKGTKVRETRFGKRGSITSRPWFDISSTYQVNAAANMVAEEIEKLLSSEFKLESV